ncbi:MAG TPA: protein-L-isoaspartate(D-aspartate) O-methyltransferase [Pirellulales bacterium]
MSCTSFVAPLLTALLLLCRLPAPAHAEPPDRYATLREQMVEFAIIGQDITNPRVIKVMGQVPRHEFVPRELRAKAYWDEALPIGEQQTISPPFIVASMTEHLDPQATDTVLEIGTGSGYQAAVLSGLVKDVYTIEIQEPLGIRAAALLKRLGYKNIHTRIGDGYKGWAEAAPFDKIIVTCSPEKIPQPLIDQLADGGRMMVPVGQRYQQVLYLYKKRGDKLEKEAVETTMFVPMTGTAENLREVDYDAAHPALVNGGFEKSTVIEGVPDGWYYARRCQIQRDAKAPDGEQVITFSNREPGKFAQILQSFGVDGHQVHALDVELWVRGRDIRPPLNDPMRRPQLVIKFYSDKRGDLNEDSIGPWSGTFDWTRKHGRIKVPRDACMAVLYLGMLGATGEISFDKVSVKPAAGKK